MAYTLGQAEALLAAHRRLEREQRLESTLAIRAALGDKKAVALINAEADA